jgi:hypothetical protein
MALARKECPVEIPEAIHASDDVVDGDDLETAITLTLRRDPAADIMEGDEIVGLAPDGRDDVVQEGSLPGAIKVVIYPLISHARPSLALIGTLRQRPIGLKR